MVIPTLTGIWLLCFSPSTQALALFSGGEAVPIAIAATVHKRPAFSRARVEVPQQGVLWAGSLRHGLQAVICSWNSKKQSWLKFITLMIPAKWGNGGCYAQQTELGWMGLLSRYPAIGFHWPEKSNFYIFMTDYEKNKQSGWGGIIYIYIYIKKKDQSWKIRGKSLLATYQWGLFQIPFFFSSVPILQSLHSENLRGNNINSISHRLEDEPRTGRIWPDWCLLAASERKESLSGSIWDPRSVYCFFLFLCVGLLFKESLLYNQVTSLTRERSPWIRSMKNK